jgi:phosphoglucomutase
MKVDPRAGQPAVASDLVDVPKLIAAYYEERPDPDRHVGTSRLLVQKDIQ